jgi:hypothetical protein
MLNKTAFSIILLGCLLFNGSGGALLFLLSMFCITHQDECKGALSSGLESTRLRQSLVAFRRGGAEGMAGCAHPHADRRSRERHQGIERDSNAGPDRHLWGYLLFRTQFSQDAHVTSFVQVSINYRFMLKHKFHSLMLVQMKSTFAKA